MGIDYIHDDDSYLGRINPNRIRSRATGARLLTAVLSNRSRGLQHLSSGGSCYPIAKPICAHITVRRGDRTRKNREVIRAWDSLLLLLLMLMLQGCRLFMIVVGVIISRMFRALMEFWSIASIAGMRSARSFNTVFWTWIFLRKK